MKELRRVNKADCEPPKPDADVVALANDVAERYVPDDYRVSYDEKGRLKLPAKPDHDDRLALCAWLTGTFELDVSHPIIAARRYGERRARSCSSASVPATSTSIRTAA